MPRHVAIVMDGNGRWAKQRGLPRTRGHEMGEHSLFDVVEGAIEIGVKAISAYAFSTENWTRSPDEVKFLMGFNRDVIRRRRDEMHELGVRVRWAGRAPRLWKSVIRELQVAEELTRDNKVLTLTMCVNYGGRAEVADTARSIAREVAAGRLDPEKVDEKTFARHLYVPEVGDADMIWRTSGEQRLSNFMLWQAAYAELVFTDVLWPDCDRLAAVEGDRALRPARPQVREGLTARGVVPWRLHQGTWSNRHFQGEHRVRSAGPPTYLDETDQPQPQAAQVPKISRVWLTSVKPCSAAIARVQRSTAGPSTSTVRAAGAADQVVVVGLRAAAVDRLAVLAAQHVDLAGVGVQLEGAVDGGQTDGRRPTTHRISCTSWAERKSSTDASASSDRQPLACRSGPRRPGPLSARHSALRGVRGGARRARSRRGRRAATARWPQSSPCTCPCVARGRRCVVAGGDESARTVRRSRCRDRSHTPSGQAAANPASDSSTMVGPGATLAVERRVRREQQAADRRSDARAPWPRPAWSGTTG